MTRPLTCLTLLFAALCAQNTCSAAVIVAGIDDWDSTTAPTVAVTGTDITASASASASSGAWSTSDTSADLGRGSSGDTTWGTFDGAGIPASAVTNVGASNLTVTNARPSAEVTLAITNNGLDDWVLEEFHMDVVAFRFKAPTTYALNVLAGSDITVGNVFTSPAAAITALGSGAALGTGHDVHDDLDLDLTGLADNTLAPGESAMIQIAFSGGEGDNSGGHHLFLDNVAVSGSLVPEPSSFVAFLSLVSLCALGRRRFI